MRMGLQQACGGPRGGANVTLRVTALLRHAWCNAFVGVVHLLDPTDPNHFQRWCDKRDVLQRDPDARLPNGMVFVRRSEFGAYLIDTLRRCGSSGCILCIGSGGITLRLDRR